MSADVDEGDAETPRQRRVEELIVEWSIPRWEARRLAVREERDQQ